MLRQPKLTFCLGLLPHRLQDRGWQGYFHVSYLTPLVCNDLSCLDEFLCANGWRVYPASTSGPRVRASNKTIVLSGGENHSYNHDAYLFSTGYQTYSEAQAVMQEIVDALRDWATHGLVGRDDTTNTPEVAASLLELEEPEEETPAPTVLEDFKMDDICLF